MPGNGPGTSIEILVDASQVSTGIAQAENALKGGLDRIASSGRTAASGTGALENSLNRITKLRTPNFLGLINSELLNQIPLLKGSGVAMGIAQTAMFGFSTTLSSLIGGGGLILAAAGAIALLSGAFDTASKKAKDAITSVSGLGQQLVMLIKIGSPATATQEALKEAIAKAEKNLAALEAQTKSTTATFSDYLKVLIPTQGSVNLFTRAQEIHNEAIKKAKIELEGLKGQLKGVQTSVEDAEIATHKFTGSIQEMFDKLQEIKGLPGEFLMSKPEDNPAIAAYTKAIAEWNDKWREMIMNLNQVQDEIKVAAEEEEKAKRKAEEFRQSFANITAPLKSAFADAFQGISVNWGKLLERMAAELAASAILSILGSLFFPEAGFKLFGIKLFQSGADFIPRTQLAVLHRGEAVVPSYQNTYNQSRNNFGASTIIINNYGAAAMSSKKIAKDIRRAFQRREFEI